MAKVTLEGVVISVSHEKRLVEVERSAEELDVLAKDGKTEKDVGPKVDAVNGVCARVAVAGHGGGPRPAVFPQFLAPIEVWGAAPSSLGQTVQVSIEVEGL